ncbi:MAG: hypothetical protein WA702_08935 [Bradyrhizobium sp.]|jgi:hypothetical protein|uniref:hypothetical protein n=1 Tax=Bradyrhizobium sp. TaxID=376 RepID=UPI003C7C8A4B
MTKPFLSFTIEREGKTIQLCANDAGIDKLIEALQKLKKVRHMHLWDTTNSPKHGILSENAPFGQPAVCEISMTTVQDDE